MTLLAELRSVGKVFPHTNHSKDRIKALYNLLIGRKDQSGSRVLHDISLKVKRGESLAIIGANGAGKSTLLKILTGVLRPTAGSVSVNATVAALLELGAGFQSEFSGLENVRLKASLLGLSRAELAEKMDEILAFADIGESIHEPVKHYSSGMVVRLGFAVVTAVKPELLITDEILAVGDESFQAKCIRWIKQYLKGGGTLLMVSHSMYQVQKLCKHALWIEAGEVRMSGDVFRVTQSYLAWHEQKTASERRQSQRISSGLYRVKNFRIETGVQDKTEGIATFTRGDQLIAELDLSQPDEQAPVAMFGLVRADGTPVYGVSSDHDDIAATPLGSDGCRYRISFDNLALLPGSYSLRAHAMDPQGLRICDTQEIPFIITGASLEVGFVYLPHRWLD
ncbi:MAG: ABC transporter ATP-binding protein [Xanthomonadales bacterium]|nr:ABC transporter ATP-binding protein [Xanthomonadales bacterium]